MKIVHLILTSGFAGSERYAVELANLQARSHDVTFILHKNATEDRADAIARRVDKSVNIILVSNFRPLAVLQARRVIVKLQPDVSHAHLSWGCRILKRLPQAGKRLATLHITYKPKQHAHLDGVIAIAPWQLPLLPEPLLQRSIHIDNWSSSKTPSPNSRLELRQQHAIPQDAIVFGTLGRVELKKGLDAVIQAFKKAALPNAKLVIVGDGKALAELRTHASDTIIFPGYTAKPENWLSAFDVFVSGARSEPFGLVFLEAMHACLPIIASASEGAKHLAQEINTPLIAIDDVDGFADAFVQFADKYKEQPQSGKNYNLQRFDLEARGTEVMEFYRRHLDGQFTG